MKNKQIWTIGHSTLDISDFTDMLAAHGIRLLADVRRFPASSRYPHFNRESLEQALAGSGISYKHFEALGGRRPPQKNSQNTAWQNSSFRGYADYMETQEFKSAINELISDATSTPAALMCAESVWWRCHRSLIADQLKSMGWTVLHIMGPHQVKEHPYTQAARVVDGQLVYRDTDLFSPE